MEKKPTSKIVVPKETKLLHNSKVVIFNKEKNHRFTSQLRLKHFTCITPKYLKLCSDATIYKQSTFLLKNLQYSLNNRANYVMHCLASHEMLHLQTRLKLETKIISLTLTRRATIRSIPTEQAYALSDSLFSCFETSRLKRSWLLCLCLHESSRSDEGLLEHLRYRVLKESTKISNCLQKDTS